ncbi:MAG: hypothetical protein QXX08_04350 [Candidatus Bathyarchaeia archaeon]
MTVWEYITAMKKICVFLGKAVFYIYGFLWTIVPRKVNSMQDVLDLFYLDFLMVNRRNIEIVKLDEDELITRCNNPCPILKVALLLHLDTRYVCKEISETVSKYVLCKLNSKLTFQRNYDYIRPYKESCEERIFWRKT